MRIRFADTELERLYEQEEYHVPRLGSDLAGAFRTKVAILEAAKDERDLRQLNSLRFKKLKGKRRNQYAVRLNDQWRLILRLEHDQDGRFLVIVEVIDYH